MSADQVRGVWTIRGREGAERLPGWWRNTEREAAESTQDAERSNEAEWELTTEAQFSEQTAAAEGVPDNDSGVIDCEDFDSHREAQAFFERTGWDDPYWLDDDGDGIACEWLP